MGKIWRKLRKKWLCFWEDDAYDPEKKHLSQKDKRSLLYSGFMISAATMTVLIFVIGINNIQASRQNAEDMADLVNMIATYMATATDSEYEKIAETIRHDLVFSESGNDVETLIQYIPNTAEGCKLERESYPFRACLVFPNTGELYELDFYEEADSPDSIEEQNCLQYSFGYDEISETHISIATYPGEEERSADIQRGRGIVSAQRMKNLFCDTCIREMLHTMKGKGVEEVLICDLEQKKFYPVEEGTLQIGSYELEIMYRNGDYTIEIAGMKETQNERGER